MHILSREARRLHQGRDGIGCCHIWSVYWKTTQKERRAQRAQPFRL